MEAERGLPKKRLKKAIPCNTETSIVLANPSHMVFPANEAVANATHKKRKRHSSSGANKKKKGSSAIIATTTSEPASVSNSVSNSTRSATGSNDPVPLQSVIPCPDDTIQQDTQPLQVVPPQISPTKKLCTKKKLTPRKTQVAATTSSPDTLLETPGAKNSRCSERCFFFWSVASVLVF